ncbi:tetratricopeptide repeat protein [Undibacterium sp. Di27W]|uniref:tetratricopeptide repeat protein n=1 Tax=Undibacterium sp. Di27W TaxID=3413036 RepID=UPI003BF3F261
MTNMNASQEPSLAQQNTNLTSLLTLRQQEFGARVARLETYLHSDPENQPLLLDAFTTALHAAFFEKAEQFLKSALSIGVDASAWQFRCTNLYIAQGRYAEAEAILQDLQQHQGKNLAISHNMAFIRFQQVDYEAALAVLDAVIDIEASTAVEEVNELQVLRFRCMHRLLKLDEAVAYAIHLEKIQHLSAEAAGVASLIAVDAGQLDLAANWARLALAIVPEQVEALVANATVALSQKNTEVSRHFLLRALAKNSVDGRILSLLGFTEMYDLKIDQALSYLQSAVVYMPDHIGTHLGLGWLYFIQKDLESAQAEFETALALDHNFSESHGAIAVIAATQNEIEKARLHIELALRLDKANLSAPYAQAILSGEANDAEAIKRLAQRLLKNRFKAS